MATLRATPPPGTVTLNNSVEYLPMHYLSNPCLRREGGMGKPKHELLRERQVIAITWQELRARNLRMSATRCPY